VFTVYILRCANWTYYVGSTTDVALRLARHNNGTATAWTAARRPVRLMRAEHHVTRTAAMTREREIKRWTRAKKQALIAGDTALLKRL
jgi:predicted GIY-YIG superfamily endonuclease